MTPSPALATTAQASPQGFTPDTRLARAQREWVRLMSRRKEEEASEEEPSADELNDYHWPKGGEA